MCVYIYYVLLFETTELYPGPHICDGTYSRVGSPGKIWLIKKQKNIATEPSQLIRVFSPLSPAFKSFNKSFPQWEPN